MSKKKSDSMVQNNNEGSKQVVICQGSDGKLRIEAQLQNETIWLSQIQIAELFGKVDLGNQNTLIEAMQNLKPNTIVKKLSFDDLQVINDLVSICKSLCITNRLLEQGT